MVYKWQTIRVFISSTFRDMHAERDYLLKYVFPELRQWCSKWKLNLVDIDLRWGVTQQEAESGKVIDICLDQIDNCRPFFICILGNRYGWVPKPGEIPQHTRERYDRIRGKENYSITHLEIHHALFESLDTTYTTESVPYSFFYFRDENAIPSESKITHWPTSMKAEYLKIFFNTDAYEDILLKNLKNQIRNYFASKGELEKRIFQYSPGFDENLENPEDPEIKGRIRPESLMSFGKRVLSDLQNAINLRFKERIEELSGNVYEDYLSIEQDYHESFIDSRTRLYVNRRSMEEILGRYIKSDSDKYLVVSGEAGSGKTSLLAKLYLDIRRQNEDGVLIPHFIGASPNSSSLYHLLRRFIEIIQIRHNLNEEIPDDINSIVETFKAVLCKSEYKVIIISDGIDQLNQIDLDRGLSWLLPNLPKNVKVIISVLGGKIKNELQQKAVEIVNIPPLDENERVAIIKEMPSVFCKTLEDHHILKLLQKEATRNPLYLKVALEELRVFGSFERLGEMIDNLPDGIEEILEFMLNRLEQDTPGVDEVESLFCLLECSRYGLREKEIEELLAPDFPDKIYLVVFRQVRDYIEYRGDLVGFYHRSLSKAVRKKYLGDNNNAKIWHTKLSSYFEGQPLWLEDSDPKNQKEPNRRKLMEQPWQEIQCKQWDEIEKTLCGLFFIEAKCGAGMIYDLVEDYVFALASLPENQENIRKELDQKESIEQYIRGLVEYAGRWGKGRYRHIKNRETNAAFKQEELLLPEAPISFIPWSENDFLNNKEKILNNPTRLDRIGSYAYFVNSQSHNFSGDSKKPPGFMIQQAYNEYKSGPVAENSKILIESDNFNFPIIMRRRNCIPEYNPSPVLIRTFEKRADTVNSLIDMPLNGKLAISACHNLDFAWDLFPSTMYTLSGGKSKEGYIAGIGSINENHLLIYNLETGKCLRILKTQAGRVTSVNLTPDGRLAVSGGDDTIQVWNMETGDCQKILKGPISSIKLLGVTSDGCRAVSIGGSFYGAIRVWDLETGECLQTVARRSGLGKLFFERVYKKTKTKETFFSALSKVMVEILMERSKGTVLSITPDGRIAIIGCKTGALEVWNIETEKCLRIKKNYGLFSRASVSSVIIRPDGQTAVSAVGDGILRIWELNTMKCLRKINKYSGKATWLVNVLLGRSATTSLSITPDGRLAISGSIDGTLHVWDLERGENLKTIKGHSDPVVSVKITADGRFALSGSSDGAIRMWDIERGEISKGITKAHSEEVTSISLTPDGCFAVSVSRDKTLCVWNAETGECLRVIKGHVDTSVSVTADGRRAISGNASGIIHLWNLETGKCLRLMRYFSYSKSLFFQFGINHILRNQVFLIAARIFFRGLSPFDFALCLSVDGRSAISGNTDGTISMWDIQTGRPFQKIKAHSGAVKFVWISTGKVLAVTGNENRLCVWDIKVGDCVRRIKVDSETITSISVTKDIRTIVSGTVNGNILVWDVRTGECLKTIKGHSEKVNSINVTADGRIAASVSDDKTLRVWDLKSGECICVSSLPCSATTVLISNNGEIVTGDRDGYVFFHEIRNFSSVRNFGGAYSDPGETQGAIEYYKEVLALLRETGNRRREETRLGNLGAAYSNLGQIQKAIEYYEQVLAISREIGDRRGEGVYLGSLGDAYSDLGETQKGIEYYEQALAIAREIGDRRREELDLGSLGIAYSKLGETRKAIGYFELALVILRETGDRHGEGKLLSNLGRVYSGLGETRKSIQHYEQALAMARENGNRQREGEALSCIGNGYLNLGDVQKGVEYYEGALTIARETDYRYGEGGRLAGLGLAYFELGDITKALEYYEDALAIARKIENPDLISKVLKESAYTHHNIGQLADAWRRYEEALSLGMPATDFSCAVLMGVLCMEEGKEDEANRYLTRGIDLCRNALVKTQGLYDPLYKLAVALLAVGDRQGSKDAYKQALDACSTRGVVNSALRDLNLLGRAKPGIKGLEDIKSVLIEVMDKSNVG